MNAKVNIKVEVMDGPDQGYIMEDSRVVPIFEPLPSKYVTPYSLTYKFMTPGLQQKMLSGMCDPDPKSRVGFEELNIPKVSEVIDMLKIILESGEPIQTPSDEGYGFSTLVKDVMYEGSFNWVIESAIAWLERIPKEE